MKYACSPLFFCSVSQESDAWVRQLYDPVIVEALSGITSVLGFSTEIVKLNFCGGTQMIKRNGAISFIGFAEYTCSSSKNRRPESRLKLATLSDPFSVKRLIQQTSQPRVQDWLFFCVCVCVWKVAHRFWRNVYAAIWKQSARNSCAYLSHSVRFQTKSPNQKRSRLAPPGDGVKGNAQQNDFTRSFRITTCNHGFKLMDVWKATNLYMEISGI